MDDSNPVASALQMFFGDEDDDVVATRELAAQLATYQQQGARFHRALGHLLDSGDEREALGAVEEFANRNMGGSGTRALAWLRELRERLSAQRA